MLYIERWIKASFEDADHNSTERLAGTPQGGEISPLLVTLFMHDTLDKWMKLNYRHRLFERHSDDPV